MKTLLCVCLLVFAAAAPCRAFELASPDFKNNESVPVASTCDGNGLAPGLVWSGAPAETKSFALTCTDPDALKGGFTHWLVYDIPASASAIKAGGKLPSGSSELPNDYGKPGFGKACPPSGTHRYIFTLYALNADKLNVSTRADFLTAVKKAQIGTAHLTATYRRK